MTQGRRIMLYIVLPDMYIACFSLGVDRLWPQTSAAMILDHLCSYCADVRILGTNLMRPHCELCVSPWLINASMCVFFSRIVCIVLTLYSSQAVFVHFANLPHVS